MPIYDAGDEGGQLYVAMRYVEGTDLGELIARRRDLAPAQAVEIIGQVGAALDAAHERGLVHRDVKPANVLLEARGVGYHAYLSDFGLVKAIGAASGVVTRTGQWLGTPDYAAPEQVLGTEVDARTDVYALGCMLYHMIAGRPPFEGDNQVAKLFAHVTQPPPSLLDVIPGAPAKLDDAIRTALAKEPAERQLSAGEFASAAGRAIGSPPTGERDPAAVAPTPPARRDGQTRATLRASPTADAPVEKTPARAGEASGARASEPAERRSTRARRRWLIAAAAVAVLGGAIAVVAGGGGDEGATAAIAKGNLTTNPSFERNTSGWDVSRSDIAGEQASDAPDGEKVARVNLAGSPGEYSIDDFPETVSSSRKGGLYTASAWVKATEANDGAKICITLREGPADGDAVRPSSTASVKASADGYREVQVTHRASAGGKAIGVHVFRSGPGVAEGEAFLVDAISLTQGARAGTSAGTTSC